MTLPMEGLEATVQSVVQTHTNGPLLATAAVLYIRQSDEVLDMTFGRGAFWTDYVPTNLTSHDIRTDGVDFRALPEPDDTFDVVVFDPPYVAQGGRDTSTTPDFLDRYGLTDAPVTPDDMMAMIGDGINEAVRVVRPGGFVIIKCMQYVSGGTFHNVPHKVVNWMTEHKAIKQVDEFIHYSGTGPQPEGRRQLTSRRAHSNLLVFRHGKYRI